MLVDVAFTMWPGCDFHTSITRLQKKSRLSYNVALDLQTLIQKCVAGSTFTKPFRILETSSRSALSWRFSSDISPVRFRRSCEEMWTVFKGICDEVIV